VTFRQRFASWCTPARILLWLKDAHPLRFRCPTGHAFSADSLIAAVSDGIEEALWNAVRALEEGGLLLQDLSRHLDEHGDGRAAQALAAQALEVRRQSDVVRGVVTARNGLTTHKS
jgi:two-component system chemotaxis response regulator CheB